MDIYSQKGSKVVFLNKHGYEGSDETANVIATNQSKENAELMVKIAPAHLPREIVTMEELERMERV